MMLTSADSEFWSKKSSTPSSIDVRCPTNAMYNKCPSVFKVNDSTLHKVVSLTLNKLGTRREPMQWRMIENLDQYSYIFYKI